MVSYGGEGESKGPRLLWVKLFCGFNCGAMELILHTDKTSLNIFKKESMEIMGKVELMNLTVCPVGETTTQRGAVMSSFETQQVTLRTKSKSKPKIKILNFSVIMLLKVEWVSIILLRLLWCAVWDKVKGALKAIIASQPRGIVSRVPSNTKSTLHVFKRLSRDSITVRATAGQQ